jgi:hypothetical protein
VAVAVADTGALPAGVTVAAEELGDLCFQRGLEQQTGAEPSHILQDLAEVAVSSEELVDLGADALGG